MDKITGKGWTNLYNDGMDKIPGKGWTNLLNLQSWLHQSNIYLIVVVYHIMGMF